MSNLSLNKANTKTQMIRKSGLLSTYIVDKIDNNQKIKRLLFYNSLDPLAGETVDYNSNIVKQQDIKISLKDSLIHDYMFNDEMLTDTKNQMFIYTYAGKKVNGDFGDIYVSINIAVPKTFERITNGYVKRTFAIGSLIEDEFQEIFLDSGNSDEYIIKNIGNPRFEITNFDCGRVTKSSNLILLTLVLKTSINISRVQDDNL